MECTHQTLVYAASTIILTLVYFYLYLQYRERHMGIWALSWAVNSLEMLLDYQIFSGLELLALIIANQVLAFISGLLLLWGTYIFLGRTTPKWWVFIFVPVTAWIAFAVLLKLKFHFIVLPIGIFLATTAIGIGIVFIRHRDVKETGKLITGSAFILWGIYKGMQPFIEMMGWLDPWGYLAGAVPGLIIAMSILVVYLQKSNKDLLESESKFRLLAENAQDIIYRYQLVSQPKFEYISPAVTAITGYPPAHFYKEPELLIKITHPDDHQKIINTIRAAKSSDPKTLVLRLINKDGNTVWTEQKCVYIKDEYGNAVAIVAILRDITERVKAEESLREIQSKYVKVVDSLQEVIFEIDVTGKVNFCNRRAFDLFGYTEDDIKKGFYFLDAIAPEDKDKVKINFYKILSGEHVGPSEYTAQKKNGCKFPVIINSYPVSHKGKTVGTRGILTDITEIKKAEKNLRASHQRLLDIIEFLPDPTFVINEDKKVIAWNRAITEMTGVSKEDSIGKNNYSVAFYGYQKPMLLDLIGLEIGEIEKYYPNVEKIGNRLHTEIFVPSLCMGKGACLMKTASPLFDLNGNIVGAIESVRDITREAINKNELRSSREHYRALYGAVSSGVLVLDREGRIIDINNVAVKILGFDREELLGRSVFELSWVFIEENGSIMPVEKRPSMLTLKKGLTQNNVVYAIIHPRTTKPIWLHVNSVPLLEDGKIKGAVITFMDITSRKEAEAELIRRKHFTEQIMQTAEAIILVLDPDCNVVSINSYGERLIGYREEEIVGKNWLINFIPDNDREEIKRTFNHSLNGITAAGTENYILAKDGKKILVRWYNSLLHDESRNVSSILAVGHDITELRKFEAYMRQSQKMEAIGQLAGGIAHDFNNLLTGILGNINLALGEIPQDNYLFTVLNESRQAAKRASEITEQILNFSRKDTHLAHPVNINECVTETVAILRRTINPGITIVTHLDPGLWLTNAEPSGITQVIMNLCLNSIYAMPDGGVIDLKTGNLCIDANNGKAFPIGGGTGDFIVLTVSDTGFGISPEVRERIFEPFFTTREKGSGTGLGLAVVYGIIERHGGWIECESEIGAGTRFTIYFPRFQGTTPGIPPAQPALEKFSGNGTILVVDDEEMLRKLVTKILVRYGYKVITAENGTAALDIYRREKNRIHLVLLDLTMPGLSGQETMIALKKINPGVKVIFSSGYSSDELNDSLLAGGDVGFIQKPYEPDELANAVWKAINMIPVSR